MIIVNDVMVVISSGIKKHIKKRHGLLYVVLHF